MVIKVGLNGFGRIGRVIFRTCLSNPEIELSAINDPAIDIGFNCYLIRFDSTHGKFKGNITHTQNEIKIDDRPIRVFREKLPQSVPWQTVGVQYVIEASGMFTCLDKASGHLASDGVKRVIVTAPSVDAPMIILGVNDNQLNAEQKVISCASSTLYCLAPIAKVLDENFGVVEGFITSIHAMTPSLKPLDGLCLRGKHWRDHRSIHQNIIPASTGACKALAKIIPQLKDKMSGLAFRVPIVNVSVLDLTVRLEKNTTIQDIIKTVEKASKSLLQNIIKISKDEAVSSDFIGESHSCVLDADSSLQLKPNFFKIICWYENEYSYACRVLDSIFFSEKQFNKPMRMPTTLTYVRAKPMRKQDGVQQTDRHIKELSMECKYNAEAKILCSTSHETGFKRKPLTRPMILRKPLTSHHSGTTTTTPAINRGTKTRNELFKIWNDNNDTQSNAVRQDRNSFFHSCIAFGPKSPDKTDCMKAQERLDNVKREFSKMVDITEDLLKKSYQTSAQSFKGEVKFSANGGLNVGPFEDSKTVNNGKYDKIPENHPIFKVCGDYKNSVIGSPAYGCSKEEERSSSRERNACKSDYSTGIQVYSTTGEVRKNFYTTQTSLKSFQEEATTIKQNSTINSSQANSKLAVQNNLAAWINKSSKKNVKLSNAKINFQEQVAKTMSNFIDGLSHNVKSVLNEQKTIIPQLSDSDKTKPEPVEEEEVAIKIIEDSRDSAVPYEKITCNVQTSKPKMNNDSDPIEKCNSTEFKKYLYNKDYNMHVIDEELKKRNIILVNKEKEIDSEVNFKTLKSIESEQFIVQTEERRRNLNLNLNKSLNRFATEPVVMIIRDNNSGCCSPGDTVTTISNGDGKRRKPDLYDKLDSASATDSNNSFEINEKKSQVIQITDLTNSLEDLARLDKICRIIEISDELSDKLFSTLDSDLTNVQERKWSFKDLCERIKLDDFCNKVFGKTSA